MNVKTPGVRTAAATAAVVAGVLMVGPALAQSKSAVVEVERPLQESARGQSAVQELTRLRDEKQAELTTRQEQLAALQQQYNDGRLTFAEDRLAEMEKQLEDMTIDLRRAQDDANREMQKVQGERFGEIEQAVLPIISQVGREFGYTAIFNKFQGGLLFAADAADITNLIIERYNAAYPATPAE
ncbi:MAG: OmpH family outer membrane protein [Holophagales bacterium]|nr:OmpH family outer membrane protein [Holophagales bacterium]